jgi:hypothetical protein
VRSSALLKWIGEGLSHFGAAIVKSIALEKMLPSARLRIGVTRFKESTIVGFGDDAAAFQPTAAALSA